MAKNLGLSFISNPTIFSSPPRRREGGCEQQNFTFVTFLKIRLHHNSAGVWERIIAPGHTYKASRLHLAMLIFITLGSLATLIFIILNID